MLFLHKDILFKGWMKEVRIEENTLSGVHGSGISASQVNGLSVRGNTFERYNPAVLLRASQNVQAIANTLRNGSRRIVVDPSCDTGTVEVRENQEAAMLDINLPITDRFYRVREDKPAVIQPLSTRLERKHSPYEH